MISPKWDRRFLEAARFFAGWSRDYSTKTGAVIVDDKRRIVSIGFNGFARGVVDSIERLKNREIKYRMVVHCEVNAIIFAQRDLEGCTLYTWPFGSCSPCAAVVIQSGIKRVVSPPCPADKVERWGADLALAEQQFCEAGVRVDHLDLDESDLMQPVKITARQAVQGKRYLVGGKPADFGYLSVTGQAVFYEPGECNMQDSFAVHGDTEITPVD